MSAVENPMSRATAVYLVGQHSYDHYLMDDPESHDEWSVRVDAVFEAREAAIRAEEQARYAEVVLAARRVADGRTLYSRFDAFQVPSAHMDNLVAALRALENPIATA